MELTIEQLKVLIADLVIANRALELNTKELELKIREVQGTPREALD